MGWWQRHFRDTPRGRIVALLRRGTHTVYELAQQLGVTHNAVRAQLGQLERDGMVSPAGIRRDGAVGKPATLYSVAPQATVMFSSAYAPLLSSLLAELSDRLSGPQLEAVLRAAGRRLAPALPEGLTRDERVQAAAALLTELGAEADLLKMQGHYEIRGHGCVLSAAVVACPSTCEAVATLLAEVTGTRVREQCDRDGEAHCRFIIPASN